MAQAAGLYLFPFSRNRQVERSESGEIFNTPGPLKICKKSIVPYGREKIHVLLNRKRKLEWRKPLVCISFRFRDVDQWNVRNRVKFLIPPAL